MKRFPSVIKKRKRGCATPPRNEITPAERLIGEFYIVGEEGCAVDVYWHRKTVKSCEKYLIVPACFVLAEGVSLEEAQILINQFIQGGE
jgi:hypothetical protein